MHHRLPTALSIAGLLCLACVSDLASAGSINVTWVSPSDGDAYGSGDTIVGRWSSDKAVVSPSFRICVTDDGSKVSTRSADDPDDDDLDDGDPGGHDDDEADGDDSKSGTDDDSGNDDSDEDDGKGGSCGATVWPTIEQSDGSYFVHLSLPNVTSVARCYLEMIDNFGDTMASPSFSFGASANDSDSASATNDTSSTADQTSMTKALNPSGTVATVMQTPNAPQTLPSLDVSHAPVPTAAYAVPLSLVISVILAAGGLSVHQRRKLRSERQQEQESLKTRGAPLSRHSTLSFGGFVNLGSRPQSLAKHREAQGRDGGESRSTSVSMMRAWRRDVSRHERRPGAESRASDATLAHRTEDARSLASEGNTVTGFTSLPRREPRRHTREAFYTSRSGGGRTTVPASAFRAGMSPVFPSTDSLCGDYDSPSRQADLFRERDRAHALPTAHRHTKDDYDEDDEDWGRLKRKGRTLVDPGVVDPPRRAEGRTAYLNASVNDSVMERYFNTSPVPPIPSFPPQLAPVSVSRPERLHVRRYAELDDAGEKALPPAPRDSERQLYDAVARRIARDTDV
ncbi:hypothetical protein BV20DRAFT_1054773 [Pilatotrama ljubarskyi]|nr:hypothetical protein BV20DRAFT_1054773 [Pilatotrama ljubarskyi]